MSVFGSALVEWYNMERKLWKMLVPQAQFGNASQSVKVKSSNSRGPVLRLARQYPWVWWGYERSPLSGGLQCRSWTPRTWAGLKNVSLRCFSLIKKPVKRHDWQPSCWDTVTPPTYPQWLGLHIILQDYFFFVQWAKVEMRRQPFIYLVLQAFSWASSSF